MDKSGILVGGTIGALIVIVIFTAVFVFPPESLKPGANVNDGYAEVIEEIPSTYSKNLSLVEIFEKA